jgi:hypothetical protein
MHARCVCVRRQLARMRLSDACQNNQSGAMESTDLNHRMGQAKTQGPNTCRAAHLMGHIGTEPQQPIQHCSTDLRVFVQYRPAPMTAPSVMGMIALRMLSDAITPGDCTSSGY